MKKFTKICLIGAAVLGGVGLLLCGIAAVLGGYGSLRLLADNGELNHGKWHIDANGIYYGDDWEEWNGNDTDTDVNENAVSGEAVGSEGIAYTYDTTEFKNLDIDVGGVEISFTESEQEEALVVTLYNCKQNYYEGEIKDGTLYIEYEPKQHMHHVSTTTKLVVAIPAGMNFDVVDIDMGAVNAEFSLDNVSCSTLSMDVGAANVIADSFNVKELLDVTVGAGNLEIAGGSYKNVKISCGVGNFDMCGVVSGDVEAECGMGNMDIRLNGDPEAYDYELSCGVGRMVVNGVEYSGIAGDHHIKNKGASGTISIECGMGEVEFAIENQKEI